MGLRALVGIALLTFGFAFVGCSKDAQKIAPDTRGKRGERCQARNDCESGLACLNNTCSKNEFAIDVVPKQCDRIECETTTDCCGDKNTEAPPACKGRDVICSQPTLPGCIATLCTSDATCNGGSCYGTCTGTGQIGGTCVDVSDCPAVTNTCIISAGTSGTCSSTGTFCDDITPCSAPVVNCSTKSCHCQNPDYNPSDPICTEQDCVDICLLRCDEESQLCLEDTSCELDSDCTAGGRNICSNDGRCVECTKDSECDEENDESCVEGTCKKPCEFNEECPLFNECDSGVCKYVGCHSDRECILAASRGNDDGETPATGGDDPRMFKCLPSETEEGVNVCKIPCENDGSCGQFQVCDKGYCKFVGCETDEECRGYLGITSQMTTEARPFVPRAVCRE